MAKSMRLGGGGRFQKLMGSLMKEGHSKDSARRLAAYIGRKKYGETKMAKWSAAGRKRSGRR